MSPERTTLQKLTIPHTQTPLLRLLWRVYGYLRPYSKLVIRSYLSLFGILGLSAFIPQLIRWIIDKGIEANQPGILGWSVLGLLALTIIKGLLNYFLGIYSEIASQNVAFDLRNEIQRKLTMLSFSFHDHAETGELLSRAVQDVERIRFLTGRATIRILDGSLLLLTSAVIMLIMDYRLGIMVLLTMPILIYRALYFGTRFRPLSLLVQKQLAALTTAVEQNLRGAREVKTYAQEEAEIALFSKENKRSLELAISSARMQSLNMPLLLLIANLGTVVVIWYGGSQVIQGQISIGEVIAFITYIGQLIDPVRRLGLIIPAVAMAGSSAERIFDILDQKSDVKDEPGAQSIEIHEAKVRYENVSFHYSRNKVLDNINFEVQAGQRLALLGATGSGKSTIISLLPRFYDPTAGRILIDDHDIRSFSIHSLRSQIGIVLQETTLFAASIRENIAFGTADASEEAIIAAAKAAQAHQFIMDSEHGYDTRVGERGVTLSGGQKQRLAIARAILLDPKILILDDATASVDSETEHLIQIAFQNLMAKRTTFVIAHRLSTVREADLILVMEHGQISAAGTHPVLLDSSPLYRQIYERQLKSQDVLQ